MKNKTPHNVLPYKGITLALKARGRDFFIIALLALFAACGEDKTDVPKEYIQLDTMVQVMADMHVIEAKSNLGRAKGLEEGKQMLVNDYEQVFYNHNLQQKRFEDSYKFYSGKPELFNLLFEKVIEELNRRMATEQK